MIIKIPAEGWTPRSHQLAVWGDLEAELDNVLVIGHRRFGKGELMLNDCARRSAKRAANYFYMLPQTEHVRKAIWTAVNPPTGRRRIEEAFPDGFCIKIIENEMTLEVRSRKPPNRVAMNEPAIQHYRSRIHFTGSDNYNTLRGGSGFGYYFDEWAWADPQALAILRPIVAENGGFFRFLTTACGKNHAYKMLDNTGRQGWGVHLLPNKKTGVFSAVQLQTFLEENIDLYGPEVGKALFEQEYECSFEEIVPGSFYLDLLLKAEREGRMRDLAPRPELPIYAAFDLGFTDPTAIWFVQPKEEGWVDVIDYDEITRTDITEIAKDLRNKSYLYSQLLLPHDGANHHVLSTSTVYDVLTSIGFSCCIMEKTSPEAQIASVRMLLPRCRFNNTPSVKRGLECLRHYHNTPKTEKGKTSWSQKPVHDWSSHASSAFATLAYFAPTLRFGIDAPKVEVRDFLTADRASGGGWMR